MHLVVVAAEKEGSSLLYPIQVMSRPTYKDGKNGTASFKNMSKIDSNCSWKKMLVSLQFTSKYKEIKIYILRQDNPHT